MREILFRGKRVDTGEWVEGFLSRGRYYGYKENSLQPAIDHEEKGVMCTSVVKPETVGQYTGLTDINGTKIFEGDILEAISSLKRGVVKYNENYGMFVIEYDNTVFNLFNYQAACSCCVIANIYDNPELMIGE